MPTEPVAVISRLAPLTVREVAAGSTTVMLDASMRTSVHRPVSVTSSRVGAIVTGPPAQSRTTDAARAGEAAPTSAAETARAEAATAARDRRGVIVFTVAICPATTCGKRGVGKIPSAGTADHQFGWPSGVAPPRLDPIMWIQD